MTQWNIAADGSVSVKDKVTGRTYSISETDGAFLIEGISRSGRARAKLDSCPRKSQAVIKVMDFLHTARLLPAEVAA